MRGVSTAVFVGRDGVTKTGVYHQGGSYRGPDGREHARYTWEHPYSQRKKCVACTEGRVPDDIKAQGRAR